MKKNLLLIITVMLTALCVYLYIDRRASIDALTRKIAAVEAEARKGREDCETRIAYLKAERDREAGKKAVRFKGSPLLDIVKKLPADPKKVKRDAFSDMSAVLKLDETHEMQLRAALANFEKEKGKVFEKARVEKKFILDPSCILGVNEARRNAMREIGGILTEEQLRIMKENDFDMKLGLRETGNPRVRAP